MKFGLSHGGAVALVPVQEKTGFFTLQVEVPAKTAQNSGSLCGSTLTGGIGYPFAGEFIVLAAPLNLISEGSFAGLTANTIPIHVMPSSKSIPLLVDKNGVTTLLVFNLENRHMRWGIEPSGSGDSWLDLLVSVPWTDAHVKKFSGLRDIAN